jgi:hypothetical protein
MRDYCKHWYTSCRCRRLAGVGAKLFVVLSLLLFMTASYAQFQLGTARVTSVVPVNDRGFPDPACVRQDTPPRGTEYWDVRQDNTYRVRLEGVTECNGDTIQVHIFNPFRRTDDPEDCYAPQCLTATRVGEGIYEFEVNFDNISSKTYYIRYCTNSDCSAGGFLARRSDGGSAPSLLRLAHFDPRTCEFIREDKTCFPKGCPTIDKLELGCNPERIPDCSELYDRLYSRCEGCPIIEIIECRNGEDESDPDRGPCWKKRRIEFDVIDCEFRVYTVVGYINWQEDEEPPVVNNVPPKYELGCNPDKLPDCDDLIALFGIEAKDNCPHEGYPRLRCEAGEVQRDGCKYRQVFTFWAEDKCGNRSPDYPLEVNWNEDTEAPKIELPPGGDLGCNPEDPPDCDDVIVRDNCPHDPPTVDCRVEDRRDGCIVTRTITVTATDKCGNSSTATEVYTWNEDTEAPKIELPPGGDLGCNPEDPPDCDDVIVRDNCPHDPPTVDCRVEDRRDGCIVTRTITVTATDKCGNSSTATEVYTWNEDTEAPKIELPPGGDLGCNPEDPPDCDDVIVRDNCPHDPPTVDCRVEDRRDGCIVTRTITVTATDKCGNSSTATEVYTWNEDTEAPKIELPPGGDLGCNPEDPPDCDDVIVRDNCPHDPPTVDCRVEDRRDGCIVTRTITVTATDKCGNSSTATEVYTWNEDTEAPKIELPPGGDLGCNPEDPPDCDDVIVRDNCPHDPPTVDCRVEDRRDGCIVTRTITVTATDKCGNSSTATEVYTWNEDTEAPKIELPPGGDLGCNPEDPPDCDDVIVRDNCPHDPPTVDCRVEDRRDGCIVTRTITVTATDKCGNSSTATEVYTWNEDTEAPKIELPPGGDLGCNPEDPPDCDDVIVRDNCPHDPPTVDCRVEDRRDGCIVTRTITVTATDKCGNSSTATEVYTWNEDTEAPKIELPPGGDLGCNPEDPPDCDDVIVRDNCPHDPPTVDCRVEDRRDGCIVTRTITVTATDKCGNSSTATEVYTWQEDEEPPVINNLPRGGKLPCNTRPSCEYLIERYNINVKDNCDREPRLRCEAGEVEQVEDCQFRQTFRFWAVDKCGNRTQDYFVTFFWKEDTEPPVLHNLPEGGDLGCNPSELPTCETIGGGVTATDNCDPNPRVTCFSSDLQIGCLRIRSFNFVAADECGNVATAKVFYYWTVDTTPPVVRCPDDIVVQADPKECFVEVRWRAKADDDCDPNPRLVCDPPSGSLFPLGTTTVTCTATDRCGNTASCSFTVTVLGFICGTKFHDLNGNGVRDPGEPGLPGWTIELVDPATNTVLQTVVTGPDGRYCFLGLQLGDYIVREVLQPGWVNTTPIAQRRNLPRDCGKQVDFGNRRSQ